MRKAMRTPQRMTAKVISIALVACAELELDTADRKTVSVGKDDFGDTPAIHIRAVRALEVVERVAPEAQADLGVLPRHASVVESDVVLRVTADRQRIRTEDDVAAFV